MSISREVTESIDILMEKQSPASVVGILEVFLTRALCRMSDANAKNSLASLREIAKRQLPE